MAGWTLSEKSAGRHGRIVKAKRFGYYVFRTDGLAAIFEGTTWHWTLNQAIQSVNKWEEKGTFGWMSWL